MVIQSTRTLPMPPPEEEAGEPADLLDELHEAGILDLSQEQPGEDKATLVGWADDHNVARHIHDDILDPLGMLVVREYEMDESSRAEWLDDAKKALKFATQEAEQKQYPWPKASNLIFPLITTAALQFWAKAYPAIIQNRDVVKGMVWGDDEGTPATQDGNPDGAPKIDAQNNPIWIVRPGEKLQRATRIGEHMSWQLLEDMPEWEPETSVGLMQAPIVGGFTRKTFRDFIEKKNVSVMVPLENLVWDYKAPSFEAAPRKTEILTLYPHQVRENELADETFLGIAYGAESGEDGADTNDTESPRTFLEQHRRYDLDGDGYAEPWIVTVHKQSQKVVRIVARYDEEGIKENKAGAIMRVEPVEYYTLYGLLPNVKGGSYPMGFGHMLKPINEGVNTTLNQMFDAGHLANTGSGLIGTNLSMHAGPVNFQIGQFKPVSAKGGNIRDSVYQFQWPGPSPVLFQLLGFMVQAGKEVAAIQDIITDPGVVTAQPTTLLAIIETGMRVYTAMYKGMYRSLKSEFDKLYRLNRLYLPEDSKYQRGDEWRKITQTDYRLGGGVKPIADPTMVTDIQKLGRAGVLLQFKDDPIMNPLEVRRRYLEAAHITDIDKLLPKVLPPPPPSPEMLEIQVKQQELVATLGRTRAQELQAYTQAMLNFSKAKVGLTQPQVQWMEAMLNQMRLQIEAINSTIKAADVDAKMHGHAVTAHGNILSHRASLADIQQRARELAHGPDGNEGGAGGPGPATVQPMAPPPGNGALPAIPGGPPGGLPAGGP